MSVRVISGHALIGFDGTAVPSRSDRTTRALEVRGLLLDDKFLRSYLAFRR